VRTRWTAPAFAAAAFALVELLTYDSGAPDRWSYTRYSAPIFLALTLSALEDRPAARRALLPGALAVALMAAYPYTGIV
jgi:hypothetical protein